MWSQQDGHKAAVIFQCPFIRNVNLCNYTISTTNCEVCFKFLSTNSNHASEKPYHL